MDSMGPNQRNPPAPRPSQRRAGRSITRNCPRGHAHQRCNPPANRAAMEDMGTGFNHPDCRHVFKSQMNRLIKRKPPPASIGACKHRGRTGIRMTDAATNVVSLQAHEREFVKYRFAVWFPSPLRRASASTPYPHAPSSARCDRMSHGTTNARRKTGGICESLRSMHLVLTRLCLVGSRPAAVQLVLSPASLNGLSGRQGAAGINGDLSGTGFSSRSISRSHRATRFLASPSASGPAIPWVLQRCRLGPSGRDLIWPWKATGWSIWVPRLIAVRQVAGHRSGWSRHYRSHGAVMAGRTLVCAQRHPRPGRLWVIRGCGGRLP